MDNAKRKALRDVITNLNTVSARLEAICDKETDCMDNYPENLQGTEKYEKIESAVDNLNDAIERIDEATESIRAAIA